MTRFGSPYIGMREFIPLEQKRFVAYMRQRIAHAVAKVQSGRMPALAEAFGENRDDRGGVDDRRGEPFSS